MYLRVACTLGWLVQGLGVVPGLFCPHYDITEGNGVIRANDFTTMMQRHSGSMLSTLHTHTLFSTHSAHTSAITHVCLQSKVLLVFSCVPIRTNLIVRARFRALFRPVI